MTTKIFVNLPVRDLEKSKSFFTALGFVVNPQFTDHNASCIVISDTIYVMLLVHPFFGQFTSKAIGDTATHTEMLLALSADSREEVDAMMARGLAAGASEPMPVRDMGFMYQRSLQDLDGHLWEVFYMNEADIPAG